MVSLSAAAQDPRLDSTIKVPPTSIETSLMRGGPGAYAAARGGGKTHAGVDIVANQSSQDREVYKVVAVGDGTVAYSRINGSATEGYGHTVVIDHGNGIYTQYSHLAIEPSQGLTSVGRRVTDGQVIGYLADLARGHRSSGNVLAEVVRPYDKIQLHFEVFTAPAGRTSTGALEPIKSGGATMNPTSRLRALNYRSF